MTRLLEQTNLLRITESNDSVAQVEQGIEQIKRQAGPWLAATRKCSATKALFRGVTGVNKKPVITKSVRSDRQPLSSSKKEHEKFDAAFEKNWGWKARSSGLFGTGDFGTANSYGEDLYLIFPVGQFKYLWSDKIDDLYSHRLRLRLHTQEYFDKVIRDEYTDKNICAALSDSNGTEIMINAKKYIGIYKQAMIEYLKLKGHNIKLMNPKQTANLFINKYLY